MENRYWAYRIITSRTSGSAVVIDQSVSASALTGLKYTISSPLDIDPGVMLNAFVALAEAEFVHLTRTGENPSEKWWSYKKRAEQEIVRAQCTDNDRSQHSGGSDVYWRLPYTYSNEGTPQY